MLNVYWYGYGGSSWLAEKLRYLIEDELGMRLITIHEHPNADIPWNLNTVYQELEKADIIIIPANFKRQPCKSNNRLTQAMALKKPIVCDPMPSYKRIVINGENAFITEKGEEDEWRVYLTRLRDDPELRIKLAENAFKTSEKYTLDNISKQWMDLFKKEDRKLDVVIPTRNNLEILDECLKSFRNSGMEEEVYIIDNGEESVEELVKQYDIPYEVREI